MIVLIHQNNLYEYNQNIHILWKLNSRSMLYTSGNKGMWLAKEGHMIYTLLHVLESCATQIFNVHDQNRHNYLVQYKFI